jgi:uncharacterized sulfatase
LRFRIIRDRMAERFDIVRVVRDRRYQYHRNFMPHLTWSQSVSYTEAVPTMKVWRQPADEGQLAGPTARYFRATKPVEELYDNDRDPDHLRNLADSSQQQDVLERMRAECQRWMTETADLGLLPEHEVLTRAGGSTPYQIATDAQQNPLATLCSAAGLANRMEAANIPQLVKLLVHEDAAVRWWGTLGLVALGSKAKPAETALRMARADSSPDVRVAAAEALGNLGDYTAALPVLTLALEHDAPLVRLAALNVLDRFGPQATPALPAIRRASMKNKDFAADYVNRMVQYVPAWIEQGKRESDQE